MKRKALLKHLREHGCILLREGGRHSWWFNEAQNRRSSVPRHNEIMDLLAPDTTVVAIDEAQFFDSEIVSVAQILADRGLRVIVAGLDMDFRGEPFGPMPILMSMAEKVDKLHAICVVCGEEASRTQRLVDGKPARFDDPVVIVGAAELYEARCREHHQVPRS